jgi:hypothetical protein
MPVPVPVPMPGESEIKVEYSANWFQVSNFPNRTGKTICAKI